MTTSRSLLSGRRAIVAATEILASIDWIDRAYDPYEFILKPVIGDWAGFRGSADAYRNTAAALRLVKTNLTHGRTGLSTVWEGNAADSCEFFLAEVCAVLPEAATVLEDIATEYENAAQGAKDFSSTVGAIISNLVDAAIVFAAAMAGGAATAATGVGLLVGGGVAVYEALRTRQMRNGQMRSADIFAVPAYREHLIKGLEQAKERHEEMFGAVEQAAAGDAKAPAEAGDLPETTPPDRDDDELDELPINWVRR